MRNVWDNICRENQNTYFVFGNFFFKNRAVYKIIIHYYYWYSAIWPVWAETRVQSGDWYGSGTLHPKQVLRGSLPLLSPAFKMFPLFTTRCLHVRHDVRDPSGRSGNCGRECCPVILPKWRLPRQSTTWDRRLSFPSEGRRAEDFFALKNPTASAGFVPANLGTKGQHATPLTPKPLSAKYHMKKSDFQWKQSVRAYGLPETAKKRIRRNTGKAIGGDSRRLNKKPASGILHLTSFSKTFATDMTNVLLLDKHFTAPSAK